MDGADREAEVLYAKTTDMSHPVRPPKPRQISRFDHSPSVNNFYLTLPTHTDLTNNGLTGNRARTPTNQRNSNIGLD